MPENNQTNEITGFQQSNPWLEPFALSDRELKDVALLISRVLLGSDDLKVFYEKLRQQVKRDEATIKKIAVAIATKKFLPFASQIKGVDEFIKRWGGAAMPPGRQVEVSPQTPAQSSSDKRGGDKVQPASTNAHLSFFTEDDEEIRKISAAASAPDKRYNYQELAEEIITEFSYQSEDEVLAKRLKNIVVFRLKDIRDEIETLEILRKSAKIGGLEMSREDADKLVHLIRNKLKLGLLVEEAMPSGHEVAPLGQTRSVTTPPADRISFPAREAFPRQKITLLAKREEFNNRREQTTTAPMTAEIAPLPASRPELPKEDEVPVPPLQPTPPASRPRSGPVGADKTSHAFRPRSGPVGADKTSPIPDLLPIIDEEDGLPVIKSAQGGEFMARAVKPMVLPDIAERKPVEMGPAPSLPLTPTAKPQPKPFPQPRPSPAKESAPKPVKARKPLVDGVRMSSTLIGPVEELGTMTLINFRRLGETPYRATAKIKDKIDLLEKESYAKKLTGIAAWHKSEVNRFYRLLGQESLATERGVEDIINERLGQNKPTLSIEEFNSVMELNRQLRY